MPGGKWIDAAPLPDYVPAGWYPDPLGVKPARYWDGTGWSKHARDAPGPTPVPGSGSPATIEAATGSDMVPADPKVARKLAAVRTREERDAPKRALKLWATKDALKNGKAIFAPMAYAAALDPIEGRLITRAAFYTLSAASVANVTVGGDIVATSSRKTLTRSVTMGIFATQKKGQIVDKRTLVFQAEDHDLGWAFTLTGPPGAEVAARRFAQTVGLFVAGLASDDEEAPAFEASGGAATSAADELTKLAELFKSGVLTEDEFTAAKARLLGL